LAQSALTALARLLEGLTPWRNEHRRGSVVRRHDFFCDRPAAKVRDALIAIAQSTAISVTVFFIFVLLNDKDKEEWDKRYRKEGDRDKDKDCLSSTVLDLQRV
jgi:hypothetical protein